MSTAELATINWMAEADHHLNLVIGGWNSNIEYWEDRADKEDIEEAIVKSYYDALNSFEQTKQCTYPFLCFDDIMEDIICFADDHVQQAAALHFNYSEDYEEARNNPDKDKRDEAYDELCSYIWESESCAYSPYYDNVIEHVLAAHRLCFISINDSDWNQGVAAYVNDCQNILISECQKIDEENPSICEDVPLTFVRYSSALKELGASNNE